MESGERTSTVIDPETFRRALGRFCTGVTVISAVDGAGAPVGFACQSFAALSLDPPLVLFCPDRGSVTWPVIRAGGVFTVNVLAHDQREISSVFGRSGSDKFATLGWALSPNGGAVLDGVLVWVDCSIETVLDGGDHEIVIGRVTEIGEGPDRRPLLFFGGAYTATETGEPTPGVLDNLITWQRSGGAG